MKDHRLVHYQSRPHSSALFYRLHCLERKRMEDEDVHLAHSRNYPFHHNRNCPFFVVSLMLALFKMRQLSFTTLTERIGGLFTASNRRKCDQFMLVAVPSSSATRNVQKRRTLARRTYYRKATGSCALSVPVMMWWVREVDCSQPATAEQLPPILLPG